MGVEKDPEVSGLGGWLILVMIGLIFTPISALMNLSEISMLRDQLTYMSDIEFPMAYFTIAQVGYIVILLASIVLMVMFFSKKKLYVPFAIAELMFRILVITLLTITGFSVPMMRTGLIMSFIFGVGISVAWIMYYKKSERVRNTFIE